ncbi:carboxy-S-adenosyl-L-methionine synthase CmoA [Gammaproteobacteria bacterium]|nr:carboxy-S-adenosyl-L-methionine synthase CmoA [Gammaproteobacteria bacterium]
MSRDQLFSDQDGYPSPFAFDDRVASVFPDMVERSVPGYREMLTGIGLIAQQKIASKSKIYDLGASLGAVSFTLEQQLRDREVSIVAVDLADSMHRRLAERVEALGLNQRICCRLDDVTTTPIDACHLVVLNLTMQFIAPTQRLALIQKIYDALRPGGVLIIAEKLSGVDPLLVELHEAFKRAHGYSELEIARKREALHHVMQPDSDEVQQQRLRDCGFSNVSRWFQYLNFAAWVAIRP